MERAEVVAAAAEGVQPLIREMDGKLSELRALHEAGLRPVDEKVRGLEARLDELEEEARLAAAKPTLGEPPSFRGALLTDPARLRDTLRADTRAIDSSLFVSGGKLEPEQAERFIDFLVEKTVTISRITTRRMMSPQGHVDRLELASRKLRKATEGVAPTVADAIGTGRRTLTTVEVIWAEDITLTFLEDNIEREGVEEHIARMLARGMGNDLNDLGWNGDVAAASGDVDFLTINDGWLKMFGADPDASDVDASGAAKATEVLAAMLQAMPFDFKARTDHAFFVPVGFAENYANEVATRQTGLGDEVLVSGFPRLRYFGIPVLPEPHLRGDQAVLTPTGNLFHGVQRSVTVDSEWVPRKRVVEYTLTARNDYEYATGAAVVLAAGIPAAML